MCKFLSLISDGQGNVKFLNAEQRKELREDNENGFRFDSHSSLAEYYGLREDKCNKYEIDVFNDFEIVVDTMNAIDDYRHVERYVKNNLIKDFGGIDKLYEEGMKLNKWSMFLNINKLTGSFKIRVQEMKDECIKNNKITPEILDCFDENGIIDSKEAMELLLEKTCEIDEEESVSLIQGLLISREAKDMALKCPNWITWCKKHRHIVLGGGLPRQKTPVAV